MSEPNYHEIDAAVCELDRQIDALQTAKRDLWKGIRDEHGKKLADQIKLAVKLNRLGSDKRMERDEIEDGAFRILSILQQPRAPRATRVHRNIEEFPPHNPETGEITDTQEQPTEPDNEIHERPSINAEAYPEAGLQAEASLAGTGTGTLAGHEGRSGGGAASADLPTNSHSVRTSSLASDSPASTSSPEPGTQFNNPRCLNACHLAHSREACHECLVTWSRLPKDEQTRLWAEANEAARAA